MCALLDEAISASKLAQEGIKVGNKFTCHANAVVAISAMRKVINHQIFTGYEAEFMETQRVQLRNTSTLKPSKSPDPLSPDPFANRREMLPEHDDDWKKHVRTKNGYIKKVCKVFSENGLKELKQGEELILKIATTMQSLKEVQEQRCCTTSRKMSTNDDGKMPDGSVIPGWLDELEKESDGKGPPTVGAPSGDEHEKRDLTDVDMDELDVGPKAAEEKMKATSPAPGTEGRPPPPGNKNVKLPAKLNASWFLPGPAVVQKDTKASMDEIRSAARKTLAQLNARFTEIMKTTIASSVRPNGMTDLPWKTVLEGLQHPGDGGIFLNASPSDERERFKVCKFVLALTHVCFLAIRYADHKGDSKSAAERAQIRKLIKSLNKFGIDFIRTMRELLILVPTHNQQTNKDWMAHPFVKALFSGTYSIRYVSLAQLMILWLRCSLIVVLPATFKNLEQTMRSLDQIDPYWEYFKPAAEALICIAPLSPVQHNMLGAEEEVDWLFKDDGCHVTVQKWTGDLYSYNPIKTARDLYHPAELPDAPEVNGTIKRTSNDPKEVEVREKAKEEAKKNPYSKDIDKVLEEVIDLSKDADGEEEMKEIEARFNAFKKDHKTQEQDKKKKTSRSTSRSRNKQVTFDEQKNTTTTKSQKSKKDHQDVLHGAGKGYVPLGSSAAAPKGSRSGIRAVDGEQHLMQQALLGDANSSRSRGRSVTSTRLRHGLPFHPIFNQMEIRGGLTGPGLAGGGGADSDGGGSGDDQSQVEDSVEASIEARQERIEKLRKRKELEKEEKELMRAFLIEEEQANTLRHEIATRNGGDGGRAFVRGAFSVQSTYARPCPPAPPEELERDVFATMKFGKNAGASSSSKDPDRDLRHYFEEAETSAHMLRARKSQKIPVDDWEQVTTVEAGKTRVLNSMLVRQAQHSIEKYVEQRLIENDSSGDFNTPIHDSPLFWALAQRSSVLWFFDQIDEVDADPKSVALRYVTLGLNGHWKQKAFTKNVDRIMAGEKVTLDKQNTHFVLGTGPLQKEEIAQDLEDILQRGQQMVGNIYLTLKIADRKIFSEIRALCEKVIKDVKPVSSKNNHNPMTANKANAEKLAVQYTIGNVIVMLIFSTGKLYTNLNRATMIERYEDILSRFNQDSGNFPKKASKKNRVSLCLTFTDELMMIEKTNPNVSELFRLMNIWIDQLPDAEPKGNKGINPKAIADGGGPGKGNQHLNKKKYGNQNQGGNQNHGGGQGGNQQYNWPQLQNYANKQWDQQQYWNQQWPAMWQQQNWNTWNQSTRGGGKGGQGGGTTPGSASLGPMPRLDTIPPRPRPDDGGDPDPKRHNNGGKGDGGKKEQSPKVLALKKKASEKTGVPLDVIEATPRLCAFHLCELADIKNGNTDVTVVCLEGDACRRDPGHKITIGLWNSKCAGGK
eukprot:g455.t1